MNLKNNFDLNLFLTGKLTEKELYLFFKELQSSQHLHSIFNSEVTLESQIFTLCSNIPHIKELCTEEEWNELIFKATKVFPLDNVKVLTPAKIYPMQKKTLQKKRAPTHIKFLIAACFLAAFLFSGVVRLLKSNPVPKNEILSVSSERSNERISSIQSIANKDVVESKRFQTDSGNGLLYIGRKTAGFIGTNTKMTYAKKDTSIFLDITSGSILFTVEKGKYNKFTIITPYAKINVTGTVFRIDALNKFTKVSVIEGSVTVHHVINNEEVQLFEGNVAVADTESVTFFKSDDDFTIRLPQRKLLDAFLKKSIYELSNDSLSSDQKNFFQMLSFSINKHLVSADSLCDLYCLQNKTDSVSKTITESRVFEKKSMIQQAVTTGKQSQLPQNNINSIFDILLFRQGALSLVIKDSTNCLKYWSDYLITYPTGIFSETVLSFLLVNRIEKKDFKKADSILKSFTDKNEKTLVVEKISYSLAEVLRVNALYEPSLYWYEFILDNYSDNEIRSQAAYWVGWSIIQLRTLKTDKRGFSFK